MEKHAKQAWKNRDRSFVMLLRSVPCHSVILIVTTQTGDWYHSGPSSSTPTLFSHVTCIVLIPFSSPYSASLNCQPLLLPLIPLSPSFWPCILSACHTPLSLNLATATSLHQGWQLSSYFHIHTYFSLLLYLPLPCIRTCSPLCPQSISFQLSTP